MITFKKNGDVLFISKTGGKTVLEFMPKPTYDMKVIREVCRDVKDDVEFLSKVIEDMAIAVDKYCSNAVYNCGTDLELEDVVNLKKTIVQLEHDYKRKIAEDLKG